MWGWRRNGRWGLGELEGNPPSELTAHIRNTWSVKSPYNCCFTLKKNALPVVNVKILSPAAFQPTVCGSSGAVAAGTDHIQGRVTRPTAQQKPGGGQSPQSGSSEPRSFEKRGLPPSACPELSACEH